MLCSFVFLITEKLNSLLLLLYLGIVVVEGEGGLLEIAVEAVGLGIVVAPETVVEADPGIATLPIVRGKQALGLLCCCTPNLCPLLVGLFYFLLFATPITIESPGKVDIATLGIRTCPVSIRGFEGPTHYARVCLSFS